MVGEGYNPLIDGDQYHNSEVTVIGPASIRGQLVNAVNFISIDYAAVVKRNIGYIQENIAARKKREADAATAAAA